MHKTEPNVCNGDITFLFDSSYEVTNKSFDDATTDSKVKLPTAGHEAFLDRLRYFTHKEYQMVSRWELPIKEKLCVPYQV